MKRLVKVSVLFAVMAAVLSGCSCYSKMTKNIDRVKATATPEVLTLKGQNIVTDVDVSFPAAYFNKKAILRITPVLVFEGGESAATPKFVQGEKVKDNYTVIPTAAGGAYAQPLAFPFDERAAVSTLELRMEAKCKKGDFQRIGVATIASGVSMVQNSADLAGGMAIMADNFKRVTTISQSADIMYEVNKSNVRPGQLNSDQIALLEQFVQENSDKERTELGNVYAKGYASPEGPEQLNDKLSRARSESGKAAISKQLSGVNTYFDAAAYGEDWEGFKALVEQSDIPDKNLILQVLNMYSSSTQREQEIKNMAMVFEVLKTDILPQLRRTQLIASADITGKTDEELIAAARNNINSLNIEEMLYSALLVDDLQEQARIYKAAADKFGEARAYNNYGVALARLGDMSGAEGAFERAASIENAPEINNNLGILALINGNVEDARRYLSPLSGADAKSGKALLALSEGDYYTAVRGLEGYNLAVAEFCNGNLARAKSVLSTIDTADANYLKAVIAMREGNKTAATTSLKSAIAQDGSLRAKAEKDVEFAKLFGADDFIGL